MWGLRGYTVENAVICATNAKVGDRAGLGMAKRFGFLASGAVLATVSLLAGCEENGGLAFPTGPSGVPQETTVTIIEQEVEAPEVFQVSEMGLWDGRPSLGGIWVAHPDTADPEQVIVRNAANGKFVIGSLFIRERALPGPRLQVSSDAATALGMQAGQAVELSVTALRKREVQLAPATEPELTETIVADVQEAAPASQIPQASSAAPQLRPQAAAAEEKPAITEAITEVPVATQATSLDKPYIQIGIFGVEANAMNTAEAMRQAGILPTVKQFTSGGKTFWRVVVGPAANVSERRALLSKVREKGFADAYFVTH